MAERALIDKTDEEIPHDGPNSHLRFPKDSKWAWIVCICSFLTQVLILGVLHAFGVFFVEFVEDFKTSKGSAAWVGSVAYGLSMAVGPFVSMMVCRFGNRLVMMLGGSMCALSILASSFVNSISLLFLTFSVFYGIGTGFAITPTMTIGQEYFDKHASISVGIMTAGSSVGTLITAPLAQTLVQTFGWRNTFRFFSGTCALTVICNILIRPISVQKRTATQRLRSSPARRLMEELKLWKNRVFVVWTVAITCVMFGYYIPYVHLVSYAVDNGISEEQGSMLVMLLGAVTATGRVLFGKVVQYGFLNRLHMHQLSMVITGAGTMLLPLITSFGGLAVYVIIVGLVDGCYVVLLPLLTCSLVGSDQAVLAWGFLIGTCSITFTLGPPVAGFIYDAYGSYNIAFHVAGLPILTGGLILFLIPWAQRTSKSSSIIKVISVVQMHDEDDANNVDFVTLSKCNSVINDGDDDPSDTNLGNSITDADLSGLYFSDINQDTIVPRSPDGRRALREIDFALSALQKSDQVLSKMLGAGKKGPSQNHEIPNKTETRRSPSTSPGKASVRKSNVINISSSSGSPSVRRHAVSYSKPSARERKHSNIGVQADMASVDSRAVTPSQSALGSEASVHCFHPTASALYQAILVLEQQQQLQQQQQLSYQSGIASESSRASMSSGINPTTPLLEEFVSCQLERLIDSLRSPNRQQFENSRSHHSSDIQNLSGEAHEHGGSGHVVSGPSSRTSRGTYQPRPQSIQTKSASTQTEKVRKTRHEQTEKLSPSRADELPAPEQSMTLSAANLQESFRIGTESTPVDIPSTPIQVDDLEVFSMDPLSPFGSPPSDIARIPPPPPLPGFRQETKQTVESASSESPNHVAMCDNGAVFPMDQSPRGISHNTVHVSLSSPVTKEKLLSKTPISSDGTFKMDEDYFGNTPKLKSLNGTKDEAVDTSSSNTSMQAAAPTPVPVQTGRFTVDTVNLSDMDNENTQAIPMPPSSVNRQMERRHRTTGEDTFSIGGAEEGSPCDLPKHTNKSVDSDELDCNPFAACGDSSSVETTVNEQDIMFQLDPINDVTSSEVLGGQDKTASGDSVERIQRGNDGSNARDQNS